MRAAAGANLKKLVSENVDETDFGRDRLLRANAVEEKYAALAAIEGSIPRVASRAV